MPTARLPEIDIYYEIHGRGSREPLVFVAGLGGDHTGWEKQVEYFSGRYQCLVFDNRGIGGTDKPVAPYTTGMMAHDLFELLSHLDFSSVHLVGLSMGGAIAQEFALGHAGMVSDLVLVDTWPKADNFFRETCEVWIALAEKLGLPSVWREHLLWAYSPSFYEANYGAVGETIAQLLDSEQPVHAFINQARACIDHDALGRLRLIEAPTLIVVGEADIMTPMRFAHAMHEEIAGSRLAVVPISGHALPFELPVEFNRLLDSFFQRRPEAGEGGP